MIRVCRLIVILLLLASKNTKCLAYFTPSMPDYYTECLDELNIEYDDGSIESTYNRTCLTKCMYEKERKLDSNGNFILSNFPTNSSDAVGRCLNITTAADLCSKANSVDNCITYKTNPYLQKYGECEKYISYNDGSEGNRNHCYTRCEMIIDGNLDDNGRVNISTFTIFDPTKKVTPEEALEICTKIVVDEDNCTRDLNMYYCVTYILHHESSKLIEHEIECAKENNVYPFIGVKTDMSRTCYERCVLIKTGYLTENNLKKSEFLKKLNMSETEIEESFNTCKRTMQETDKCTKDLYFYDCISYIHYVDPLYLKNIQECALETNAPLVSYRQPYKENVCNTRCLMIKENKLDSDGMVNVTNLRQYTVNDTIISESINECNKHDINKTCQKDVNTYYCVSAKVNTKVYKLCHNETELYGASITAVGRNFCTLRCVMINGGQITPTGEIIIDSLNASKKNITVIEETIKTCKNRIVDEDVCARDVHMYHCVSTFI